MRHSIRVLIASALVVTAALGLSGRAQLSPSAAAGQAKSCLTSLILNFEDHRHGEDKLVPVWRLPGSSAFFFEAGMTIDADGAPNAYNPENSGLDDLANAGEPGHWAGFVSDADGNPYIQGPDDPFPGYYVSCTSLSDREKKVSDPAKYVDATKIPYVVLPPQVAAEGGARLGDFALVLNLRNGRSAYAIFADMGTMGEGSVALAERLGISSDARRGGTAQGVRYIVFPGSGNARPRPLEEINALANQLFQDWGGMEQVSACPANSDL
jgi:hypothetical protein